jgi:hypothetical protein
MSDSQKRIYGHATVFGDARVRGHATASGARVRGHAEVFESATIVGWEPSAEFHAYVADIIDARMANEFRGVKRLRLVLPRSRAFRATLEESSRRLRSLAD